jgi:hypothetical protein
MFLVVAVVLSLLFFFIIDGLDGWEMWHSLKCGGKTYTVQQGDATYEICRKCKKTVWSDR